MKYSYIKFLFVSGLYGVLLSCSTPSKKVGIQEKTHSEKKHTEISDRIPTVKLPWGSSLFLTHKFPKGDWNVTSEGNTDSRALAAITEFYHALNRGRKFKAPANLGKINYVNYGDDSLMIHDERQKKEGFLYKLPNFGPYQCYYRLNSLTTTDTIKTSKNGILSYEQFGDLVLINTQTNTTEIINIYNDSTDGDSITDTYRYFFIDANKTISIFETMAGEDPFVEKTQEINVESNDKIQIKNIHQ